MLNEMATAGRGAELVVRRCLLLRDPAAEPVEADVLVGGGHVLDIGAAGGPVPRGARVIEASGLLAIPGLVNAHTHSPEACLRGIAEGRPLEPWLAAMFTVAGRYDAEAHAIAATAAAVEMVRNGVTGVIDHLWMTPPGPEAIDAVCRAYAEVGIRAVVAPLASDIDCSDGLARRLGVDMTGSLLTDLLPLLPAGDHLGLLADAMGRWNRPGSGVRVFAGPGGVQWCSDELLAGCAELARRHDAGVHLHLVETMIQRAACRDRFGRGAAEALDDLGVLDRRCSLAHSVWLEPGDPERIAAAGAVVVHNPAANLRLGSGLPPIRDLVDAGVTVALGTDGAASSDNQNLWDAVKLAALVHNRADRWVTGSEALAMATAGGAAAMLAGPSAGTLVPGAPADISLVDLAGDGLAGSVCLPGALALSETGAGVVHVIVAGRPVVVDGRCITVDEGEVRNGLRALAHARGGPAGVAPKTARLAVVAEAFTRLRGALVPGAPPDHTQEVCK